MCPYLNFYSQQNDQCYYSIYFNPEQTFAVQNKGQCCAEKLNAQAYASASYTKHGDEGFCC